MTDQAENRKAWVAALRSQKYKQTVGVLRSFDDAFCCLGVACDVYDQRENLAKGEPSGWQKHDNGMTYFNINKEFSSGVLPPAVRDYFGLDSVAGNCEQTVVDIPRDGDTSIHRKYCYTLDAVNDTGRVSFDDIADMIESGKVFFKDAK